MKQPIYLVEEIGKIVSATAGVIGSNINYIFGHPVEITTRLQEMSASSANKNNAFPLIALFTDISVQVGDPMGLYGQAYVNIIIATATEQNYTASERLEHSFKPILYPIRDQFLDKLYRHNVFTFDSVLTYNTIDRYYWGRQGLYGNTGNIFNDYIDAIELQNLKIFIKNNFC